MVDSTGLRIEGLSGLRRIGSGGFSTVYTGTDDAFRRSVAVKVLGILDPDGQRRFHRELEAMGQLDGHPNVITPYRYGYTDGGAAYLVMELAGGGSLADHLARHGIVEWGRAVDLILPVADALGHAHAKGVVHLDVKPANILLTDTGIPKLTDFGISAIREATATEQHAFTLAHAPPEAFVAGFDRRDSRSDLYALGSTLYAVVAGRPPFDVSGRDSAHAYMQRIINAPVPPVGRSEPIERFIARALAKDPADRPQTAGQFADELRQASQGSTVVGSVLHGSVGVSRRGPIDAADPWAPPPPPTIEPVPPAVTDRSGPRWGRLAAVAALGATAVVVVAALGLARIGVLDGSESTTTAQVTTGGDADAIDTSGNPGSEGSQTDGTPGPDGAGDGSTSGSAALGDDPSGGDPGTATDQIDPVTRAALDQALAERVVIQAGDLNDAWETFSTASDDQVRADYLATPSCAAFAETVTDEGVTASAGTDVAYAAGSQALAVSVTFYDDEGLALGRGPGLLVEPDYQTCLRDLQEASAAATNDAGSNFETSSQPEPVTPYGQRSEAVRIATTFDLPGDVIADPMTTSVRYRIQIGRAVLSVIWISATATEPFLLQILQTVATRFEQEMAAYDG